MQSEVTCHSEHVEGYSPKNYYTFIVCCDVKGQETFFLSLRIISFKEGKKLGVADSPSKYGMIVT